MLRNFSSICVDQHESVPATDIGNAFQKTVFFFFLMEKLNTISIFECVVCSHETGLRIL